MSERGRASPKAQPTCDPNDHVEGCSDKERGVDHPFELSGIDHVSGKTWDRGMARELRTDNHQKWWKIHKRVDSHPCHEQSERDPQFWQGSNAEASRLGIPHTTWSGCL